MARVNRNRSVANSKERTMQTPRPELLFGVKARGTRSRKAPNPVNARLDGFEPNVKV